MSRSCLLLVFVFVFLLLSALSLGCGGSGRADGDTGTDGDMDSDSEECVPRIVADPETVEFGAVDYGSGSYQELHILNGGCAHLSVARVAVVEDESGGFSIAEPPSLPAVVPPGGQLSIFVQFTPRSDLCATATVEIDSNDPGQALLRVPMLTGRCETPGDLQVRPQPIWVGSHCFGDYISPVWVECTTFPSGVADVFRPVTITGITLGRTDGDFHIGSVEWGSGLPAYNNPVVIWPGQPYRFAAMYTPNNITFQDSSKNTIRISNDSRTPLVEIEVSAVGGALATIPSIIDIQGAVLGEASTQDVLIRSCNGQWELLEISLPAEGCVSQADVRAWSLADPSGCGGTVLDDSSDCTVVLSFSPHSSPSRCRLKIVYRNPDLPDQQYEFSVPVTGSAGWIPDRGATE